MWKAVALHLPSSCAESEQYPVNIPTRDRHVRIRRESQMCIPSKCISETEPEHCRCPSVVCTVGSSQGGTLLNDDNEMRCLKDPNHTKWRSCQSQAL